MPLALCGLLSLATVAGLLVGILFAPGAVVAAHTVSAGVDTFDSLPDFLDISTPAQATRLYATRSGKKVQIATFYAQNRTDVTFDQITDDVKNATVDTEDPRFYSEGPIDLIGTGRAALSTLFGGNLQGGSSLTQQYVKNVLVERCATEETDPAAAEKCYQTVTAVTLARKLRELRYAVGVQKRYTKDEILRGYLNIVGFGGNIYGIQAAATYYFGVPASDLSLAQAATLVGIVNNPSGLRIDRPKNTSNGSADGYARTRARRNYVLDQMLQHGDVTPREHDAAVKLPVTPHVTPSTSGCAAAAAYSAGYFCRYVYDTILQDPAFGTSPDARLATLTEGGLQIDTTLDLELQSDAKAAVSRYMPTSVPGMNVGASNVAVEPGTGRIVSMVQNTDFVNSTTSAAGAGATSINYNTDKKYGGSQGFQTGSAFKAFTLAAWLQSGRTLRESIPTTQHTFPTSEFTNTCSDISGPAWVVGNAERAAADVSVLDATKESINTAFAQMGTQLDLCNILRTAKAMGVHAASSENPLKSIPSMILGTNYISPLTMATAYAGIANEGIVCTPVAITEISTRAGRTIPPTKTTCTRGMSADVAAGVAFALQTVLRPGGTGASANPVDGVPILAKTGTTDHAQENWLVTSTTKMATATWVGNISGSTNFYTAVIDGVPGYAVKFNIARPILQTINARFGGAAFTAPSAAVLGTYPKPVAPPAPSDHSARAPTPTGSPTASPSPAPSPMTGAPRADPPAASSPDSSTGGAG